MWLVFAAKRKFSQEKPQFRETFLPNKEGNAGHVLHRVQRSISIMYVAVVGGRMQTFSLYIMPHSYKSSIPGNNIGIV